MPLEEFQLEDEFCDAETELALLRSLLADPPQWKKMNGSLHAGLFATHAEDFLRVEHALQRGGPPPQLSGDGLTDAVLAVRRLADLALRRDLARFQQDLARRLYDPSSSPESLLGTVRQGAEEIRAKSAVAAKPHAASATELGAAVLTMAEERLELRRLTGKPVCGIPTGLARLDQILNGWSEGLHVIAAGPGVGKTTLCLQFAWEAARAGYPALYVTYENSPRSMVLKLLCARAGQSPAEVERGFGDLERLGAPLRDEKAVLERIAVVEGHSRLRTDAVEAAARELRERFSTPSCLIVFDYLQRAAHSLGYEQLRQNVSALTGELRDIATRLESPVVAISSQNRAAGDYGRGGSGQLDSLKESGDLEYGADTVSLLYTPSDAQATPPARDIELRVAKNRFGPLGQVRLIFRPDTGVFRERA